MPELCSLPDELLCKISSFVHPQSIIDWACSSKILSRCSLQPLQQHKQRRSDLRVIHDRNPITIPSLLRSSLSEPEVLWYVRSLDIWDLRESFEEWKSPSFVEMNPRADPDDWDSEESLNWLEKQHDYSHLDITFYTDEEFGRYRNMFCEVLHLKEPLVDKWMERLQSGSDEPLKVLLMAMSPTLAKATFVQYDSWQSGERSHPFRLLSSTLRALAPLPSPQWPCFQNLKSIIVGHYTELRHPHDAYYPPSRVIAPLFLPPALEELHLNLLSREENDPESDLENNGEHGETTKPYVWEWETARSSCQKLTFSCCQLATETTTSFIGAMHSLRSLVGVTNEDEIISALLKYSKHSLEIVSFDEQSRPPTSDGIRQHSLHSFEKLAHIKLPASQLVDMSTYIPYHIEYTADDGIDVEKSAFGTTDWLNLSTFLPPTLQTFKIHASFDMFFSYQIEGLIHQLAALVHAKLSSPSGAFASLTKICLADLSVKSTKSRYVGAEPDGLDVLLGDLKRVCEEAKVDIHSKRMMTNFLRGRSAEGSLCSSCGPGETPSLDSAPVIPEEGEEYLGNAP